MKVQWQVRDELEEELVRFWTTRSPPPCQSLGSNEADIEEAQSPDLYEWRERHKAKRKTPVE